MNYARRFTENIANAVLYRRPPIPSPASWPLDSATGKQDHIIVCVCVCVCAGDAEKHGDSLGE